MIREWLYDKTIRGLKADVVNSGSELRAMNCHETDFLLGLFAPEEIAYYHDQQRMDQPSLAEMTDKAIRILSRNPNGFFLFVEGARIGINKVIKNVAVHIS